MGSGAEAWAAGHPPSWPAAVHCICSICLWQSAARLVPPPGAGVLSPGCARRVRRQRFPRRHLKASRGFQVSVQACCLAQPPPPGLRPPLQETCWLVRVLPAPVACAGACTAHARCPTERCTAPLLPRRWVAPAGMNGVELSASSCGTTPVGASDDAGGWVRHKLCRPASSSCPPGPARALCSSIQQHVLAGYCLPSPLQT